MSGDAFLERIRDRNLPGQVLVASGVEHDVDLVELPIDEYLEQLFDRPALQAAIEQLLRRRTYHETLA